MVSGHTEIPGRPSAGLSASLLLVILGLLICPTCGIEISLVPESPKVNDPVFMNVNGISGVIRSVDWYKGELSAPNQILGYIPTENPPQTNRSSYIEGATAFPNATLFIPRVQVSHGGIYIVQVETTSRVKANVTLLVIVPTGPPLSTGPDLSSGAIAGICIAVLAVVCGVVGGGVYFAKHKSNRPASNTGPPKDGNSYDNVRKPDHD